MIQPGSLLPDPTIYGQLADFEQQWDEMNTL